MSTPTCSGSSPRSNISIDFCRAIALVQIAKAFKAELSGTSAIALAFHLNSYGLLKKLYVSV